MGPDRMQPHVLRKLADVTVKPVLIVFGSSWQLREVPEDWKKANVSSFFQKGKKEDLQNYGLVTLTIMCGK